MFSLFIREKVCLVPTAFIVILILVVSTVVHRGSLLGISLWCHYRQVFRMPFDISCHLTARHLSSNPGPYGAGVFDPRSWANGNEETTNTITLEFTRVVLAIGVFAIGVELPKAYVARHWKSLFFLLGPVMAWVRRVHSGLRIIFEMLPIRAGSYPQA